MVATHTRNIAEHAARTARHVNLHHVVHAMVPTKEAGKRMRSAPYAHNAYAGERSQVHVDAVHAEHHVEMAHHYQLLLQRTEKHRRVHTLLISCAPCVEHFLLRLGAPEKQHTTRRMATYQLCHNLLHLLRRIDLLLVNGKRRHAYPLLEYLLLAYLLGHKAQVAARGREYGMKIDLHRIAQAREYVGIILESRRQLAQLLVLLRRQFAAFGHMTVYMLHTEAAQVEAHAQIARRKNIVHVGNSREVLRNKSAVEGVKPCHTPVFALQIGTHEAHIRSQPLEERTSERATQHCDAQVGILACKRTDHRHKHCYLALGRKSYNQEVVGFHCSIFNEQVGG